MANLFSTNKTYTKRKATQSVRAALVYGGSGSVKPVRVKVRKVSTHIKMKGF